MKVRTKFLLSGAIVLVVAFSSQFNSDLLLSMTGSLTGGAQSGDNESTQDEAVGDSESSSNVLRLGYFPNLNHAQVIIGLANGHFQKALSENHPNGGKGGDEGTSIQEYVFSAGPSVLKRYMQVKLMWPMLGPILQ